MIYTVTLNPALDRSIVVEQLLAEDTTRILSETPYAAGKGIDVSRVIRELGGQIVALGLVGGYDGLQLEGLLINAGVMTDFTRISSDTRTNIILREQAKGRQYAISAAGPEIKATEIGMFYQHVNQVREMDYLILSESLPRGVLPNLYGQLILAGKKRALSSFWMQMEALCMKHWTINRPVLNRIFTSLPGWWRGSCKPNRKFMAFVRKSTVKELHISLFQGEKRACCYLRSNKESRRLHLRWR